MLLRIMAVAGLKILEDPSIAEKAKAEFDEKMAGKSYKCPMPEDAPRSLHQVNKVC